MGGGGCYRGDGRKPPPPPARQSASAPDAAATSVAAIVKKWGGRRRPPTLLGAALSVATRGWGRALLEPRGGGDPGGRPRACRGQWRVDAVTAVAPAVGGAWCHHRQGVPPDAARVGGRPPGGCTSRAGRRRSATHDRATPGRSVTRHYRRRRPRDGGAVRCAAAVAERCAPPFPPPPHRGGPPHRRARVDARRRDRHCRRVGPEGRPTPRRRRQEAPTTRFQGGADGQRRAARGGPPLPAHRRRCPPPRPLPQPRRVPRRGCTRVDGGPCVALARLLSAATGRGCSPRGAAGRPRPASGERPQATGAAIRIWRWSNTYFVPEHQYSMTCVQTLSGCERAAE